MDTAYRKQIHVRSGFAVRKKQLVKDCQELFSRQAKGTCYPAGWFYSYAAPEVNPMLHFSVSLPLNCICTVSVASFNTLFYNLI